LKRRWPFAAVGGVGDNHRGLKMPGGKPIFFANKIQTNSQNVKHARDNHSPAAGAHSPDGLSGPPEQIAPAPLKRNSILLEGYGTVLMRLRLARGLDAPSGETPPHSRAGRPLGRGSASLEGWMPPRVRLCLARRPDTPSSETPPRSKARRPLE
jgi:hypothetical protein